MVLIDLVFHAVKCVHETFAVQRATCKLMFLINTGCVPTSQPRPLHPLLWISERSSIASVEVFLCTMFSLCSNMGGMVGAVITMKNCTTHPTTMLGAAVTAVNAALNQLLCVHYMFHESHSHGCYSSPIGEYDTHHTVYAC